MSRSDRKSAIAAYKERVAIPGVFAVRCATANATWVGPSRNLDAQQTGLWFSLRSGAYPNKVLQAAWQAHGADAFTFEPVERLEPEKTAYVLNSLLKDRVAHWMAKLGAQRL